MHICVIVVVIVALLIFAWKGRNEQTKKALSSENLNDIIPLWWEAGKDHDVQVPKYQARSPSLQPLTNYKQKNFKCTLQKKKKLLRLLVF